MICGFELEFHEVNGTRLGKGQYDDQWNNPARYDQEILREGVKARIHKLSVNTFNQYSRDGYIPTRGDEGDYYTPSEMQNIWALLRENTLLTENYRNRAAGYAQRITEALADCDLSFNSALISPELAEKAKRVSTPKKEQGQDSRLLDNCHIISSLENWDVKRDGSVYGGEIVSDKGTMDINLGLAKELFERNDFYIDEGCSFHIHVSTEDTLFKYSGGAQIELMLYLLSQYQRMPERVKQRLATKKVLHYFHPHVSKDKYSMVNYSNKYKTWEFRLWGNVTSYEDARVCFEITKEALEHMLAVYRRQKPSLLPEYIWCDYPDQFIEPALLNKSFDFAEFVSQVKKATNLEKEAG